MSALEAQGIRKTYGGIRALDDARLAVRPGSVHALLGENGAGKSTLVKIMTGAIRPDSGSLRLGGEEVTFANTADATARGVAVVSQELSLFPDLTVLSNLYTMREPTRGLFVDRKVMLERALPVLDQLGLDVDPMAKLETLSLAERQLVEIAKAIIGQPKILLLDEPTSALESGATERLLEVLRVLRSREVGVVFVSHILEEVMNLCDEVTVLRDGKVVIAGEPIAAHSMQSIVKAMIGDRPATYVSEGEGVESLVSAAGSGLTVDGLTLPSGVTDVTFQAQPGEVLGFSGLAGSGPAEVLRALAGLQRSFKGSITFPGGVPAPVGLRRCVAAGMAYVSGDRRRLGLMLDKPVWENLIQVRSVGMGRDGQFLRRKRLLERAQGHVGRLQIKVPSLSAKVGALSGGNQQKVVLAKWLDNDPTTLLLDDPTRGVDVGSKAEIHGLLHEAARGGAVVVLASTDLDELVSVCDRILVFYRGRICAEVRRDEATVRSLLHVMNTGDASALTN